MAGAKKSVLLFNPWIYDFAAYDFWAKPLGLLTLGAVLRRLGYAVDLVDCLDRFHPELLKFTGEPPTHKADFSGKFYREVIAKPDCLSHIPRFFARYGMPPQLVTQLLSSIKRPDVILVTSFMTYWYPALVDALLLLRDFFPGVPIVLGGIYATLCPEHAKNVVQPDYLVTGEGEGAATRLIAELLDGPGRDFSYTHLDELPIPAFDLYPDLKYVPLLTSRGCPNNCSFCASRVLTAGYRRRSVDSIVDEIRLWHEQFQVSHFAFFDDALLHRAAFYAKPLLREIIKLGDALNFYTPNGLTPRYVDAEMADLFYQSNTNGIRLSFETSDEIRQKTMSAKVTNDELKNALRHLDHAGYARKDIGVYVMVGLPGQSMQEARDSVLFVHEHGARVHVASFSPIPGTREWANAVSQNVWNPDADLLLTNTTIYPIWSNTFGFNACEDFMHWAHALNQQL